MTTHGTAQLRLVYSLLKPAVAMAARFHIPMRTLSELLRLSYFEVLRRQGLSQAAVGERLGQTARHMRTLESKLKSDFFEAEADIGLVREVENEVARTSPTANRLQARLPGWPKEQVEAAVQTLLAEKRVVLDRGQLRIAPQYVVLSSEGFPNRVDALNHFLGALSQAVAQRLLFEEREEALLKTVSFVAQPDKLKSYLRQLEGALRREIAAMEEEAQFEGQGRRYVLGLVAAKEGAEDD